MIFLTEALENLRLRLKAVTVFKGVADSPALSRLIRLLDGIAADGQSAENIALYADFVKSVYENGCDFGECLKTCVFEDENIFIRLSAAKREIPAAVKSAAESELALFSELSAIGAKQLKSDLCGEISLPEFDSTSYNFVELYAKRAKDACKTGYGIFARHTMFRVEKGEILPFESPDEIRLDSLFGYKAERKKVLDNTKALLEGKPAANVLLCGDAGTGKSSTVKAVTNELSCEGLRLIELSKAQLPELPGVFGKIRENPLKFIIFIDDLSFNKNDDSLGTLKAILEGSASAKSQNAVIYATSNRRHLVKESFSDREGDDIHANDTKAELLSLSERFGLTVLFGKPDKKLYLEIVKNLAQKKGISLLEDELLLKAEEYALRKGGRSARAAEQFTDLLLAK